MWVSTFIQLKERKLFEILNHWYSINLISRIVVNKKKQKFYMSIKK